MKEIRNLLFTYIASNVLAASISIAPDRIMKERDIVEDSKRRIAQRDSVVCTLKGVFQQLYLACRDHAGLNNNIHQKVALDLRFVFACKRFLAASGEREGSQTLVVPRNTA
jgi:hypothetical protein